MTSGFWKVLRRPFDPPSKAPRSQEQEQEQEQEQLVNTASSGKPLSAGTTNGDDFTSLSGFELPDPNVPPETWKPRLVVAATVYGEARGESDLGKLAVAFVIANRVRRPSWWGKDWTTVCLKPFQFSCWNRDDRNRAAILGPKPVDVWRRCLEAADLAMLGATRDPTAGATHYFAPAVTKTPPAWAAQMVQTLVVGKHVFLREV